METLWIPVNCSALEGAGAGDASEKPTATKCPAILHQKAEPGNLSSYCSAPSIFLLRKETRVAGEDAGTHPEFQAWKCTCILLFYTNHRQEVERIVVHIL